MSLHDAENQIQLLLPPCCSTVKLCFQNTADSKSLTRKFYFINHFIHATLSSKMLLVL